MVEKLKEGGADEDKIKAFQKKIQTYYTSKIAPHFGDFDFYTGESMDPDGMYVAPVFYVEDGLAAHVPITGLYC